MAVEAVPAVAFHSVIRSPGAAGAIRDISFEIADGEFVSMLGPSGSGMPGASG